MVGQENFGKDLKNKPGNLKVKWLWQSLEDTNVSCSREKDVLSRERVQAQLSPNWVLNFS